MATASHDDDNSHNTETLWHPHKPSEDDDYGVARIVVYVPSSSLRTRTAPPTAALPLDVFVRQLCQGKCSPIRKAATSDDSMPDQKKSFTTIETQVLVEALGCLRSLQFDMKEYNTVVGIPSSNNDDTIDPLRKNEAIYRSFRLQRQVGAAGMQLLPHVAVRMEGLNELISHLEDFVGHDNKSSSEESKVAHAATLLAQGLVDFDSLAEYYRPGLDYMDRGLLTGSVGRSSGLCVRCRSCYYRRGKSALGHIIRTFYASFEFLVATGGGRFAVVEAQTLQSEFAGTRSVGENCSMELFARVESNDEAVWSRLLERGRLYHKVCSPTYDSTKAQQRDDEASGYLASYGADSFWSIGKNQSGRPLRTGGRLMVDTSEAWARGIHASKAPADGMADEAIASANRAYSRWKQINEQSTSGKAGKVAVNASSSESDVLLLIGELPDSLICRTWPVVCGFSLDSRTWGLARVEGLEPVEFQEEALDALVLPPTRKRLVKALVITHGATHQVDVLPGKGEGLIFLLHGPPGVGKTLTAEAVSEVLHRPLYRVSMGELGTTPETLEGKLREIFDLCRPWKALVLLDEAEFLLETRGNDLVRNALVCVMLRLLEYYPGILFLTTNRGLDAMDPAVASRVTLALRYNDLDLAGRRAIWLARLKAVQSVLNDSVLEDRFLDDLSQHEVNGRQIKNIVQLAVALACYDKVKLDTSHLQQTLDLTIG